MKPQIWALAALGLSSMPVPALAEWPASGLAVSDTTRYSHSFAHAAPDGFGGLYVGWNASERDSVGILAQNPRLQRITAFGDLAPAWPSGGIRLSTVHASQSVDRVVPDGVGGVYVVWDDKRSFGIGGGIDVYCLRVLEDGTIAPGWPADGLALVAKLKDQTVSEAVPDGSGGLFVSWRDLSPRSGDKADIVGTHVLPGGTLAPGWPVNGKPLVPTAGTQSGGPGQLTIDGAGGILVSYGIFNLDENQYVRHLDGKGDLVPGWPANDVPLSLAPNTQGGPTVSDGAGGLYMVWQDDRSRPVGVPQSEIYYDIYAQHMLADGSIALGWPTDGLPLCILSDTIQQFPGIVSDGNGGFITVWTDTRNYSSNAWDIYGLRMNPDGSRATGWLANGSPIMVGFESEENMDFSPDGSGGAYVVAEGWPSGQIWIQHVMFDGQPEVGWPIEGQRITPLYSGQESPTVAWDGYLGTFAAWDDARFNRTNVFVKHYGPDGPTAVTVALVSANAEPGLAKLTWQVTNTGVFSLERRNAAGFKVIATRSPDGSGRLTFEDPVPEPGPYVYRLAYLDGAERRTSPEIEISVPSAFVLSLAGLTPNPSHGSNLQASFTLPFKAPGSLALYDVAGREVARESLSELAAGRHALALGARQHVPAGMYWVRLTHQSRTLTARGVVIR